MSHARGCWGVRSRREDPPLARHALERVIAAVLELDLRADHDVFHGAGNEDLAGFGESCESSGDVNGESAHVVPDEVALSGVDSGACRKANFLECRSDPLRAADRPDWELEPSQEAVAHGLDLFAPVSRELATNDLIMRREELAPATIPELGGTAGRPHDVGKENRREDPVGLTPLTLSGEELLDLVDVLVDVARDAQVVVARELDKVRLVDSLAELSTELDRDEGVVSAVEYERGDADVFKQVADVDLARHAEQLAGRVRARRRPLEAPPPAPERGVLRSARSPEVEEVALPPALFDDLKQLVAPVLGKNRAPAGCRPIENEATHPLRSRGGEENA